LFLLNPPPTERSTLSLHDALPISGVVSQVEKPALLSAGGRGKRTAAKDAVTLDSDFLARKPAKEKPALLTRRKVGKVQALSATELEIAEVEHLGNPGASKSRETKATLEKEAKRPRTSAEGEGKQKSAKASLVKKAASKHRKGPAKPKAPKGEGAGPHK